MSETYRANRVRGPFNATAFWLLDGVLDRTMRARKRRIFDGLPAEVVELGPGVGANLRYLSVNTKLIAVEPNPAMHARLSKRAHQAGIRLDLRGVVGEKLDLPDASADAVISSLVLCTVQDPERVVAEVLRVLRPGGRYAFLEHVIAPEGSRLRQIQHLVRRPWAWSFEGCSCERDLAAVIERAGFGELQIERYRLRSPFLPINTQIAGVAVKAT